MPKVSCYGEITVAKRVLLDRFLYLFLLHCNDYFASKNLKVDTMFCFIAC